MNDASRGAESGRTAVGAVNWCEWVDTGLIAGALLLLAGDFLGGRSSSAWADVVRFAVFAGVGVASVIYGLLRSLVMGAPEETAPKAVVGAGVACLINAVGIRVGMSAAALELSARFGRSVVVGAAGLYAGAVPVLGGLALRSWWSARRDAPLLWRDGVVREAYKGGPAPEALDIEAVRRLAAAAKDLRESRHQRSHTSEVDALLYEARSVISDRHDDALEFLVFAGVAAVIAGMSALAAAYG